MASTAEKSDPKLWDKVEQQVTQGDKGGKPGQWSARKTQLSVQKYKSEGGSCKGKKAPDNHLAHWTEEDWGTKSSNDSGNTGERYLPKKACEALSDDEYRRSTAKKRADSAQGKQFSAQPSDIAYKTAAYHGETTKAALMQQAAKREIKARSRMSKGQLEQALSDG